MFKIKKENKTIEDGNPELKASILSHIYAYYCHNTAYIFR